MEEQKKFTLALMLGAAFIALGIATMGVQLKYGATRYACITQHMSAQECAEWNTLFQTYF